MNERQVFSIVIVSVILLTLITGFVMGASSSAKYACWSWTELTNDRIMIENVLVDSEGNIIVQNITYENSSFNRSEYENPHRF